MPSATSTVAADAEEVPRSSTSLTFAKGACITNANLPPFLEGTSTTFVVQEVVRAGGGHRPSFRFRGYVAGTDVDCKGQSTPATPAQDLHLILRYEPPSPKFKRQCPGSVSYRMQVADGEAFLFSMRGLPLELFVDRGECMLAWGKLGLIFKAPQDLEQFLGTIKYVRIVAITQPFAPACEGPSDPAGLPEPATGAVEGPSMTTLSQDTELESCSSSGSITSPLTSPPDAAAPAAQDDPPVPGPAHAPLSWMRTWGAAAKWATIGTAAAALSALLLRHRRQHHAAGSGWQ